MLHSQTIRAIEQKIHNRMQEITRHMTALKGHSSGNVFFPLRHPSMSGYYRAPDIYDMERATKSELRSLLDEIKGATSVPVDLGEIPQLIEAIHGYVGEQAFDKLSGDGMSPIEIARQALLLATEERRKGR